MFSMRRNCQNLTSPETLTVSMMTTRWFPHELLSKQVTLRSGSPVVLTNVGKARQDQGLRSLRSESLRTHTWSRGCSHPRLNHSMGNCSPDKWSHLTLKLTSLLSPYPGPNFRSLSLGRRSNQASQHLCL